MSDLILSRKTSTHDWKESTGEFPRTECYTCKQKKKTAPYSNLCFSILSINNNLDLRQSSTLSFRIANTTRGTKTTFFRKWNKLFLPQCLQRSQRSRRREGKGNVQQDYLAGVWECYTCKYRSSPWSVAVLSISLHLFCLLFTRTPPSHWLALSTLSIAGSWSEVKGEFSVCEQGGSIHPHSISIYIQAPLWGHCCEKRLQSLEYDSKLCS